MRVKCSSSEQHMNVYGIDTHVWCYLRFVVGRCFRYILGVEQFLTKCGENWICLIILSPIFP